MLVVAVLALGLDAGEVGGTGGLAGGKRGFPPAVESGWSLAGELLQGLVGSARPTASGSAPSLRPVSSLVRAWTSQRGIVQDLCPAFG